MTIKAVLFDLDETLLDRTASLTTFLSDQHHRFRAVLGAAPLPAWRDRFLALDARGHVHKSVVYPALLSEFGGDIAAADTLLSDYEERCFMHARPFPGMHDTLAVLRARGFALGIVTNGETEFQTRHILALGLNDLVDTILISQTEGLRKPDEKLFARAAERLGAKPSECLFIGDNPSTDILGAEAAGIQSVWFRCGKAWPAELPSLPCMAIDELAELPHIINELSGKT